MTRTVDVPAEAAGRRLDVVVAEALGLSRAKVKVLFESGGVRVNGRRPGASTHAMSDL